MKLLPIPLPPLAAPPPLGMWGSEFLWRYPAPPSPLAELKTQLPSQLPQDPRLWGRDEVAVFLQFCEREFDLPKLEMEMFQMNGKALCLLTKNDLAERIPGAGDVLHNVLQMLVKENQLVMKHLPSSPVTPTSRYHPFSPHSQPPTPNWSALAPPDSPFHPAHIQHLMQSNSVTLSPAPSIDSQGRSPPQQGEVPTQAGSAFAQTSASLSSTSNQSDSDEDSYHDKSQIVLQSQHSSPPLTPMSKEAPLTLSQQISNVVNSWSVHHENNGGSSSAPNTPLGFAPVKREFFPETPEPNTNGRLLWDFLQQLLNDPAQRYSNFIAWKCRETGVFKIVDPAGLAKLWGIQKNHLTMNYDKMSRALRYYYRVNILRKVQGERHCYQFLRNPTELKSIKNISLLRQQPHPQSNQKQNNNGQLTSTSTSILSNTQQQLNHLSAIVQQQQQQQQQQFQHPPNSPRVHALNGAFHYLSTSSGQNSPPQPASPNHTTQSHSLNMAGNSTEFKIEPNIDIDDMPTDLSTGGERKFNVSAAAANPDCYPLIRNSNGLTTIRLICHNEDGQPTPMEDGYHSGDSKSENGATDLRKIE